MENATRHVRLKRQLLGIAERPLVDVSPMRIPGSPAAVLRRAPLVAMVRNARGRRYGEQLAEVTSLLREATSDR